MGWCGGMLSGLSNQVARNEALAGPLSMAHGTRGKTKIGMGNQIFGMGIAGRDA
jgi:hypothetical protein